MSKLTPVSTDKAPGAVGPYSQGIAAGGIVFTSGQVPLKDGVMPDGVQEQAVQCLENVKAVVEAAGGSMDKIIKCTVFLVDMGDFAAVNEVYAKYFSKPFPARSCCAVKALPLGARVEIEAIAAL